MQQELQPSLSQMHSCIALRSGFVAICTCYLSQHIFLLFPQAIFIANLPGVCLCSHWRHVLLNLPCTGPHTRVRVVRYLFGVHIRFMYIYLCMSMKMCMCVCVFDVCTVHMYLYVYRAGAHLELTTACSLG